MDVVKARSSGGVSKALRLVLIGSCASCVADVAEPDHIGDGNLQIGVLPPPDLSREDFEATCQRVTHHLGRVLQEFGGSISADGGVGPAEKAPLKSS